MARMTREQIRSQKLIFEEAKESVAHEIDQDMFDWDFSKMLEELKRTILEKATKKNKKNDYHSDIRSFARHYLKMENDRFKEVKGWLRSELAMSADNMVLVLRTLKNLRSGTLEVIVPEEQARTVPLMQPTSGMIRKVIDHTIGSFNSLTGLIVESGVKPENTYESDRMEIQSSVEKIFDRLGISVSFPESKAIHRNLLTREDLAGIGLRRKRRRKR